MSAKGTRQLSDLFGLSGRLAIVTGGGSGIGAGISQMLADAGAQLIVIDRNLDAARAVCDEIGRDAKGVQIDIASEDSVVAGFAQIVQSHGAPWALVNCAGLQDRALLSDASVALWDRLYAVNLRGSYLCLREASNAMVKAGKDGRIINIASLSAITPMMPGLAPYAATKAGVVGLTQNAALELAPHGITVNAVLPGGVDTPGGRTASGPPPEGPVMRFPPPLGICTPDDIAAAVLYLASPLAGRISAQSIAVDGGFLLS